MHLDAQGKKADEKLNSTKILGANWKQIWKSEIVNPGDTDIKTLKVPLIKKQQIFLLRHIEAERLEPDFI